MPEAIGRIVPLETIGNCPVIHAHQPTIINAEAIDRIASGEFDEETPFLNDGTAGTCNQLRRLFKDDEWMLE